MNRHTGNFMWSSGHRPERLAFAEHRPGHARVLGRHRHHRFPVPPAFGQRAHPLAQLVLFFLGRSHHRSRTQDQQHAQIAVSSFGDAPQSLFATRAVLAGHQTQPGRQLLAALEVVRAANAGHQGRGRFVAHTGYDHEPAAAVVGLGHRLDVAVVLGDAFVEPMQFAEQVANGRVGPARQIFQAQAGLAPNHFRSLRQDMAVLAEQTADSVDRGRALFDESLAHAVDAQAARS